MQGAGGEDNLPGHSTFIVLINPFAIKNCTLTSLSPRIKQGLDLR